MFSKCISTYIQVLFSVNCGNSKYLCSCCSVELSSQSKCRLHKFLNFFPGQDWKSHHFFDETHNGINLDKFDDRIQFKNKWIIVFFCKFVLVLCYLHIKPKRIKIMNGEGLCLNNALTKYIIFAMTSSDHIIHRVSSSLGLRARLVHLVHYTNFKKL